MFNLLFDTSFWYDFLIVIAIIAVIYIFIKFPHAKVYIFTLAFLVLTGSAIYSTMNINEYYSASGGIYGILAGDFNENNQITITEKEFILENMVLTQVNGDTYSARTITDDVFKTNIDEHLGVFVNNSPCSYSKIEEDYFIGYYNYSFYDKNNELLCEDTLKLYFSFYTNGTELEVVTDGGSEAVKYWNYYFNKNNFNITIKSVSNTYSQDLTIGEGDVSNYAVVKCFVNGEILTTQVYSTGQTIVFPELTASNGKVIKWKLKGTDYYVFDNFIVNSNISIEAVEEDGVWSTLLNERLSVHMGGSNVKDIAIEGLKADQQLRITIDNFMVNSSFLNTDNTLTDNSTKLTQFLITSYEGLNFENEQLKINLDVSCEERNTLKLEISIVKNDSTLIVEPQTFEIIKIEILK